LQVQAVRLINGRRVPAELQEALLSGANALAADTPPCLPTVTTNPPAPQPKQPPGHVRKHGHGKGGR